MDFISQLVKQFLALPIYFQAIGGVFALIIFVVIVKIVFKGKKNPQFDPNQMHGGQPNFDFEGSEPGSFPGMSGQMDGFNQLPQGYVQQPQQTFPGGQQYDSETGKPLRKKLRTDRGFYSGTALVFLSIAVIMIVPLAIGISIPAFGIATLKGIVTFFIPLFKGWNSTLCSLLFAFVMIIISFVTLSAEAVKRKTDPFRFGADQIHDSLWFVGFGAVLFFFFGTIHSLLLVSPVPVPAGIMSGAATIANASASVGKASGLGFWVMFAMIVIPLALFNNLPSYLMYLVRYPVVLLFASITANQAFPVANLSKNPLAAVGVLSSILGNHGLQVGSKLVPNYTGFFLFLLLALVAFYTVENRFFDRMSLSFNETNFSGWDIPFVLLVVIFFIAPKIEYGSQLIFKTTQLVPERVVAGIIAIIIVQLWSNVMLKFQNNGKINRTLLRGAGGLGRLVIGVYFRATDFLPQAQQMSQRWDQSVTEYTEKYQQKRQQKRAGQAGYNGPPSDSKTVALWDPNHPNNRR